MGSYTLFDVEMGRFLRRVFMPNGTPDAIHTQWSGERVEAWRFASLTAARNMAERLGGGGRYIIESERGERKCLKPSAEGR